MHLAHYSVSKLKKEILGIIQKYLPLDGCKVFFFGSRVTAAGDEHSDIDIGIEASEKIDFATIAKIREDIENLPVLYKIELVDFKQVSDDFRKVALQKVEPLL
jgi:predicted nucleotidyltransferase